jgi:hypothetical protein
VGGQATSNGLALRRAQESDLAALSRLIAGQNQDPATQCIHSETGGPEQALCEEMAGLHRGGELLFVLACEGDRLVGALGSEVDEGAGRGSAASIKSSSTPGKSRSWATSSPAWSWGRARAWSRILR